MSAWPSADRWRTWVLWRHVQSVKKRFLQLRSSGIAANPHPIIGPPNDVCFLFVCRAEFFTEIILSGMLSLSYSCMSSKSLLALLRRVFFAAPNQSLTCFPEW